jgi:uncharacterized protein YoxC
MTRSNSDQLIQAVNQLQRFRISLLNSFNPARIVGYGLVILALLDVIVLLIPPQFGEAGWNFQFFGQLVERVPIPLLGLGLICLGGSANRLKWEVPIVKVISWLALGLGVFYLLLAPLGTFATLQVNSQTTEAIQAQVDESVTQLQELQTQINTVQTDAEMADLLGQVVNQSLSPEQVNQPLEQIKENLNTSLLEGEQNITDQANSAIASRRVELFKNSIKWNLGTILTGSILILIWKGTKWART